MEVKNVEITNEELIVRAKAGDDSAYILLLERNEPMCGYIAKKYLASLEPFEDLVSIAKIGMIKAYNTFDHTKNYKFTSYASRCMINEINSYIRAKCKWDRQDYLEEPLAVDEDGNLITKMDIMVAEDIDILEHIIEAEELEELYKVLSKLNPTYKQVLELKYRNNMTQKEIAKIVGVSQVHISRILKKALKQLRKEFDKLM